MKLKHRILQIIGDIKIQKWPPFIYYAPEDYYSVSGQDTEDVHRIIKKGDIVLRGYDDYLDNIFIPGDFSHSGIYTGDGKVIHAVAQGVIQCSLTDFMRCDKFCLVRPVKGQKLAIQRAKTWLGRAYDYDFKSQNSAFYCHQLVAQCYLQLQPNKEVPYFRFIRFTSLDPVYLAQSFLTNPNFNIITKKGKLQ